MPAISQHVFSLMHLDLPATLTGPFCADYRGLPRYCSTIWIDVLNGHLAQPTRNRYASAANSLYLQAASMVPSVDLDAVLLAPDFSEIERVLSSSLLARQADQDLRHWQLACRFTFSILENLVGIDDPAMKQRLRVMRQRFAQLRVRPRRPSNPGRALPWLAVEDLYEIFDPASPRNPFRTPSSRWRNFVIFLVLVQLGLRRGEALSLTVDSLKQQFDPSLGEVRHWLDVCPPDHNADSRSRKPALKNRHAVRQLPIPQVLAVAIDTYVSQYRPDVGHAFLFSSAEGHPLALSSLGSVIDVASKQMSPQAFAALRDEGISKVSPHDFRHTSAVIRIQRFMDAGMELEEALHRLRPFFGWKRSSDMPFHYAGAYFAPRHSKVWDETFERSLTALRAGSGQ